MTCNKIEASTFRLRTWLQMVGWSKRNAKHQTQQTTFHFLKKLRLTLIFTTNFIHPSKYVKALSQPTRLKYTLVKQRIRRPRTGYLSSITNYSQRSSLLLLLLLNSVRNRAKVERLIGREPSSGYLAADCGVGGHPVEPLSPESDTSPVRLRNTARLSHEVRRLSRVAAKMFLWKVASQSPVSASSAN